MGLPSFTIDGLAQSEVAHLTMPIFFLRYCTIPACPRGGCGCHASSYCGGGL